MLNIFLEMGLMIATGILMVLILATILKVHDLFFVKRGRSRQTVVEDVRSFFMDLSASQREIANSLQNQAEKQNMNSIAEECLLTAPETKKEHQEQILKLLIQIDRTDLIKIAIRGYYSNGSISFNLLSGDDFNKTVAFELYDYENDYIKQAQKVIKQLEFVLEQGQI